ncbi:Ppx/GppA family phosphatase [Rubellimicrobium rubrum]|uniref:Ppx/GppA family phosphatase n=1 Tax=Rubellimicrobium rubrum TaxID=2585369 RepID=A0A5C4MS02_9RHOB|nr:Ppx/GppA family phosphatase [Rubellimicrobium rubrum]TNC47246.1 Ppx/GppA family phosphatase [Rubellimicrobium rubrum]
MAPDAALEYGAPPPSAWGEARSLFDGSAGETLHVGVIDVGSNSVRFVVFDGAARSPAYFYNEKIMCALGSGLSESGRLNPKGRVRALDALCRFAALARGMGLETMMAVATAAVREAEDGPAFVAEVERRTGLQLQVIPGDEEARLSAQGVLLGWPGSYGLVCDIGGASMELADLAQGRVGRRVTSPLGGLKLQEVKGGPKVLSAHIAKVMARLHADMDHETGMRLFLVGGSWRAIARVDMDRRNWPLTVQHEYRMTPAAVAATKAYIEKADLGALQRKLGISGDRMALVPVAVQVLDELVRVFKPKDIAVSSYGIREGMLYERMPPALRERDPLLEACRFQERRDARLPGFGRVLFNFVLPLFPDADWQRRRIIEAACLLHDVNWRAHPDYRAETCVDAATRANLGGIKHEERVYMGLALMYRYSSRREGTRFDALFKLLSDADAREAEVLGRAMRLGAMLWLGAHDAPGVFRWRPEKKTLTLTVEARARPLFGEVAKSRLDALAQAMGAEAKVAFTDD